MVINDFDDYCIVFDIKNRNIKQDTLINCRKILNTNHYIRILINLPTRLTASTEQYCGGEQITTLFELKVEKT